MLHCVALCCSLLNCSSVLLPFNVPVCWYIAVRAVLWSVLQFVVVCYSVLQCAAVCCSVLRCVAVSYSVLQFTALCSVSVDISFSFPDHSCHAVTHSNTLQPIATLHFNTLHYDTLQHASFYFPNHSCHAAQHRNTIQHTETHYHTLHEESRSCHTFPLCVPCQINLLFSYFCAFFPAFCLLFCFSFKMFFVSLSLQ